MFGSIGKLFGAFAAAGALMQGCTNGVERGADKQVCEDTVDGTTATTVIDGTTFGVDVLPDGTKALTKTYGVCK